MLGAPADPTALAQQVQVLTEHVTGPIVLRGTVGKVCDSGCWFYLLDEKSVLFVQLDLATGLAIPTESTGQTVLVKGRLADEAGQRVLHAQTVILGDAGSG